MVSKEKQALTLNEQVKRRGAITVAAVATAAASLVFGIYALASSYVQMDRIEGSMETVVVASRLVPAGSTLSEENCRLVEIPTAFCVEGAVSQERWSQVAGRVALVDLAENAQVCEAYLSSSFSTTTLSAALAPGMEAVSVSVSSDTGLSGLLRVGNRVRAECGGRSGEVETLCVRRVIALDASLSDASSSYSSVTLEVSPEEAEAIRTAQFQGKAIYFTLLAG